MGDVTIVISDGGAGISVPQQSVQLVIGPSSTGPTFAILATQNPNTLQSNNGYGMGPEAAALTCRNGGTALFIRVPVNATGTATAVQGPYAPAAGKIDGTTTAAGTSACVVTVTLDGTIGAFDEYYVILKVVKAGTVGSTGIQFQLSLDHGRTYGPILSLGTATTWVIPNTGITLNFTSATLVAGEVYRFATRGPTWTDGAVQSALTVAQMSQYAAAGGWGSTHIVGCPATSPTDGVAGSDATTIGGYLQTLETGKVFTYAFLSARDTVLPSTYGGAGESEATWVASLAADYAAVSQKRICAGAGHYNMPSAFPTQQCGTPKYRRPLAWAAAAIEVNVPTQRNIGRVEDGPVSQITVDPTVDPVDGFVYHDERNISGLTVARFMAAKTYPRQGLGLFIDEPNLMSPAGSDFSIVPFRAVMDVACTIVYEETVRLINSDDRLNQNGTLNENDAQQIEAEIRGALDAGMTGMVSATPDIVVSRTANVRATSTLPVTITIKGRVYILNVQVNIGYQSPFAA